MFWAVTTIGLIFSLTGCESFRSPGYYDRDGTIYVVCTGPYEKYATTSKAKRRQMALAGESYGARYSGDEVYQMEEYHRIPTDHGSLFVPLELKVGETFVNPITHERIVIKKLWKKAAAQAEADKLVRARLAQTQGPEAVRRFDAERMEQIRKDRQDIADKREIRRQVDAQSHQYFMEGLNEGLSNATTILNAVNSSYQRPAAQPSAAVSSTGRPSYAPNPAVQRSAIAAPVTSRVAPSVQRPSATPAYTGPLGPLSLGGEKGGVTFIFDANIYCKGRAVVNSGVAKAARGWIVADGVVRGFNAAGVLHEERFEIMIDPNKSLTGEALILGANDFSRGFKFAMITSIR